MPSPEPIAEGADDALMEPVQGGEVVDLEPQDEAAMPDSEPDTEDEAASDPPSPPEAETPPVPVLTEQEKLKKYWSRVVVPKFGGSLDQADSKPSCPEPVLPNEGLEEPSGEDSDVVESDIAARSDSEATLVLGQENMPGSSKDRPRLHRSLATEFEGCCSSSGSENSPRDGPVEEDSDSDSDASVPDLAAPEEFESAIMEGSKVTHKKANYQTVLFPVVWLKCLLHRKSRQTASIAGCARGGGICSSACQHGDAQS